MLKLENSYLSLPEDFYQKVNPSQLSSPSLIAFNHHLAKEIKLDLAELSDQDLADIFSGNKLPDNINPIALAYAGFQFGHPVPQLGDGRAHLLGESSGYDIQLKGSGRKKFSRSGDGKSALGPVLREYILSEAMHNLGVPTTRALCAVRTGEEVYRQDGPEPGGVFTRVADSHLRVGTFQYFAFKNDTESLKLLLDYSVDRHYPELRDLPKSEKSIGLLKALSLKQSELVAHWSSLGFIHGVMNTDNFSIAGITIDYGPCAFMEEFQFQKVFSSIDHKGRYSFFNQVPIAKWNILRLADCLLPLIHEVQEKAIDKVEQELFPTFDLFEQRRSQKLAEKLGIKDYKEEDEQLVMQFLTYLEKNSLDFTLSFYNLIDLYHDSSTFYKTGNELDDFVSHWKKRVHSIDHLKNVNPLYIPRNHLVQKAIEYSYQGDDSYFNKLNSVLEKPFKEQKLEEEFSTPAKIGERILQTFCGT